MEDAVFEVPREYEVLGGSSENTMRMNNQDEEEIMLQYAIRQSLGETEGETNNEQVDIWEALEGLPPGHSRANFQGEDRLLQQAIEASMSETTSNPRSGSEVVLANTGAGEQEDDLTGETDCRLTLVCCSLVTWPCVSVALRLSQEQERREREEEEEIMRKVLELSLREK